MDPIAFPLLAALVAAAFATHLGRQFAARRRPHALAWCLALTLYAAASAAVAAGLGFGWSEPLFDLYWVAGALLNVPLLAAGQLLLLDPGRARLWWLAAGLVAAAAAAATLAAGVDTGALDAATSARQIPLGREVLGGSLAYRLARPFSFTFLIVVAGSLVSAARTRRWGVLLIALGVAVVAGSSAAVRVGHGQLFSALLAAGVTIMYGGFLAASRRAPARRPARAGGSRAPAS